MTSTKTRRWLLIPLILLVLTVFTQAVSAHPMGNFSINRYSKLVLGEEQLELTYIVDMAEIPTLNARPDLDTNNDDAISKAEADAYADSLIPTLTEQLVLTVDNTAQPLTYQTHSLTFPEGQAGLPTQKLIVTYTASLSTSEGMLAFRDDNFIDRIGWQEIVVESADSLALINPSLPTLDVSNALQIFPEDIPPLAETEITLSFSPAGNMVTKAVAEGVSVDTQPLSFFATERFTELITLDVLTPRVIFLSLLLAFALGAAHALAPGHGKTIVAAYLVGSRGTAKHALLLGLTTTITHTLGVFAFGFLVLFASRYFLPEDIFPWLGVSSGILVVLIGVSLVITQWRKRFGRPLASEEHAPDYHTHFGIGHSHVGEHNAIGMRNIFALGVSGGLIPCPSALVVLLSAIALQRVGLGLVLIFVFSLGLATVLTLLGLFFVYAGNRLQSLANPSNPLLKALPVASACFVTLAGILITARALLSAGIF